MIKNPILKGFCPDPSIIRANGRYYIATSTFEWWPGVRLFESEDLKNWTQIRSPLRRQSQLDLIGDPPSGGVWAPCLSYDGERFFLVYTDVKTKKGRFYNTNNYVVWTDDLYGEWSDPVYLNSIGFDPSLFHDSDGKKYLVNMINGFKGITVQELNPETMKPCGDRVDVYKGSGIGCLEGPHIYHIGRWYYLLTAEGGTGYDHCETLARAQSVYGPYIGCPDNPILTSDKEGILKKCGHADLVETPGHEWFMVHLCSRPVNDEIGSILGRETAVQAVEFDNDGWIRLKNGSRYGTAETEGPLDASGIPQISVTSFRDDFKDENIGVMYSSLRRDYKEFASIDPKRGKLLLRGDESLNSLNRVSLLATRQEYCSCSAETSMMFEPESYQQLAGITYLYDNLNFYIWGVTRSEEGERVLVLLKSDKGIITDMIPPIAVEEGEIKLKIDTDGINISFSYSLKGEWITIEEKGYTGILSDEYCRGFTGAHFGMYVHDMLEKKAVAEYDYWSIEGKECE